ncbi:MAG: hypothetical protein EOP83_08135 [Verrucomicrobiaceae bacterium]|nr:MAG: hypothetical protein EOP83_08135 [Verrucomicrobiaceae bacterium]
MMIEQIRCLVLSAALLMITSYVAQTVMIRTNIEKERDDATLYAGFSCGFGAIMIIAGIGCAIWFSP